MAKLFGFSIEDDDNLSPSVVSPVPPNKEDGVDHYLSSGFFGSYVDIEGVYRTEFDLIKRYREMALHPECDSAIEDIVNEAIVSDTNDTPVQIDLDNLNASDGIKKKIRQEFRHILELLDFDKKSHEIYRNWYIDGRLYYHKVIDLKKPEEGIQELRYIDAMKMRYVRQAKKKAEDKYRVSNRMVDNPMDYEFPEIEEYFIYDAKMTYPTGTPAPGTLGGSNSGIRMTKDSITYCTSGLVDRNKGSTLSYLHKAIKSLNQLRMIEDSLVIYRLCLIGDTRVKTSNGYSYIKDINIGDKVYAYDNNVDSLVETKVTNKWMTGIKETYTVKSKHHSVAGTDTHPVLVYDSSTNEVKYVPIKDLSPKVHSLTYIKPNSTNDIISFPNVREKVYSIVDKKFWSTFKFVGKESFIKTLSEKTNIKSTKIRNFLYGKQYIEEYNLVKLKQEFKELENIEYDDKYQGFCSNQLNLPEFITPEFARLFGFLLGDGSVGRYGVVFAEGEDEKQNLYYANLMKTYFGNCSRYDSKNRKYTNYTTRNTLASELLIKLGYIPGAKNKRIPNWAFNASDEIKKQLILGLLDADGHYRDLVNGFSCEISLCNQKLIEDIKEIWTSLGLCSGQIRHRVRKSSTRIIGEETEPRTMPETECWELYLSEYELPKFEKIISIDYHSTEEVYDIEVEHKKHNFVANGIIVHNSRAPERRIFYIDVGNLPKVKAEQYLRDVMMRYRNKLVYDACLSMDTKVPLLDGRTLTLSEITEEFNRGERLWTYSCDPNTGEFAPGIISWSGVTRKNEKVMRITLDNDKTIVCTLDHKFPVWNKGKVEAKDLQIGDSMIPYYTRQKNIAGNKNSKYEQLYENKNKNWVFTHRLVSKWKDQNYILNEYNFNPERNDENKQTIHHKDYNRYNNSPENLVRMSRDDHFEYHKKHSSYAGRIGGKVCAERKRELGLPFFNLTKEQRIEIGKKSGSKSGKISYIKKLGIHGLTKDEIIKNSKKGSDALKEKLNNDIEFKNNFIQNIKEGWTEETRKLAAERGRKLPTSHFVKMSNLGNASRWNGENSEENKKIHSNKQTIEYTQEIFDLIQECARQDFTFEKTLKYVNENLNFDSWKKLNVGKNPRKGKGNSDPLSKFSYTNLTNVCKLLGFESWKTYKNSLIYRNHKIKNIEFLDELMDVGTLTIDREELYHDYHTFALDAGIYTCNSTGEVRDDRKFMAMLEDFWLPRREGGRGTEISTLPGGQNLGEITDIEYFKKKLYRSLNVPPSRMDGEGGFNLGRSSEILRDEVKFTKFVSRLRKRFSYMFSDMLRTQLILKNIITPEDWKMMDEHIQYDFLYDNHFSELKDAELLNERLNMVQVAEPYVGKYFSQDYVRRKILRQTDIEILEEDKQIKKEIQKGIIPDPNAPVDPQTGMPLDQSSQMDLGQPVMEPDLRSQEQTTKVDTKAVEPPKGGEI